MSQQHFLSSEVITKIRKRNPESISPENNGQRKLSWDLLSPSTPPSSGSSDSAREASQSPTAQRSQTTSSTSSVFIPTEVNSVQTYEFMGFTRDMAEKLLAWQKPLEYPQDTARSWLSSPRLENEDNTAEWDKLMQEFGIKDQVRLPMLKPEHQKILSTQSLSNWLIEIMETFYNYLEYLERNVELELSGVPHLRGGGDQEPCTVPQMPRGHIALFKSVDGLRLKDSLGHDGTVQLILLGSGARCDFSRKSGALYFTHQLWVAHAYSKLIGDSCSVADRRIIELHVPLSHLAETKTLELSYDSDEWKQLIWYSRRGYATPKPLAKLLSQHGCIKGPIAHSHNSTINKLSTWEQVAWKHVLKDELEENGATVTRVGIQHVWIDDEAIGELQIATVNKVHIRQPSKGYRHLRSAWDGLEHLK